MSSINDFLNALVARDALEQNKLEYINELISKGYHQTELATFLQNDVCPSDEPVEPEELDIIRIVSDILVIFSITYGKISALMEFVFYTKLSKVGALEHSPIKVWWRLLNENKDMFCLVGELILKSFVVAIKKSYFSTISEEEFKAEVFTRTDPYFHDKIHKVFVEKLYMVEDVCVSGE